MSVEVDIVTSLSGDGSTFGVFLHIADVDHRDDLRTFLNAQGAGFVLYPEGKVPVRISGSVVVADSTVSISVGPLYVVGSIQLSHRDLETANRASLFIVDEPFDLGNKEERAVMTATLHLVVPRTSEVRECRR